jgi:hypothetical protein
MPRIAGATRKVKPYASGQSLYRLSLQVSGCHPPSVLPLTLRTHSGTAGLEPAFLGLESGGA